MPTRLQLYNAALKHLGEPALASLSEGVFKRRVLDDVYDRALVYCLEQGQWNFAARSVAIYQNASVTPVFGFTYAFDKPSDWVRTMAVSVTGDYDDPLLHYLDEGAYFFAEHDPLYVRYVSKGASYGLDLTKWPETFAMAVEVWLAHQACEPITKSATKLDVIDKKWKRAISDARSKDAVNEAAKFPPPGRFVRARWGGHSSMRRRGEG